MYKTLFTLTLLPVLAWSQPTIATPPVNPRAGLMPISPLRSNAVGGGVRIKDLGFIEGARANQLTGFGVVLGLNNTCLLYTSPSPRDPKTSRMPSSA